MTIRGGARGPAQAGGHGGEDVAAAVAALRMPS